MTSYLCGTSHFIQGSDEWKSYRQKMVTATDAMCVMGSNPWCTVYQRWMEKIGLTEPTKTSAVMQRGIDLEPIARKRFIETTGINVFPAVVEHPEFKWMSASLDGHNLKGDVLEIKCVGQKDHSVALEGKIPDKYIPQLQHQMAVTGADKVYYYSFDGEDGCIVIVPRDDEYIKKMVEKEAEFYRCMVELEPPPLCDRDYVQRQDYFNVSLQYQYTKQQREELEKKEDALKAILIDMCENHPSIIGGLRVQKISKKGNIDYSKIEVLKDIDLETYRKPKSEYWKISEC